MRLFPIWEKADVNQGPIRHKADDGFTRVTERVKHDDSDQLWEVPVKDLDDGRGS